MSSEDSTKVWVNGKLMTLSELQQEYKQISITSTPSNLRVMEVLAKAQKPLTRQDISSKIALSKAYTTTLLNRLVKEELVVKINMKGTNYKYYLLTEKGYHLISE